MRRRWKVVAGIVIVLLLGLVLLVFAAAPLVAARMLLQPFRREAKTGIPADYSPVTIQSQGLELHGWRAPAIGERRGSLIYMHGVSDNRTSGIGILERFRNRGFDVLAYDSRAHGSSGGAYCTYGYFERHDVSRAIDELDDGPVVLIGSSLGAAVSLQAAPIEPRITCIVAAETFADLRTIAVDRAPKWLSQGMIDRSFRRAEAMANFFVGETSPLLAAPEVAIPVLMLHGEDDVDTLPLHTHRVFEALKGPKRLIMIPHTGHNGSLKSDATWSQIEEWIDSVVAER